MDQRGTDQAAPTPLSRALDTIKKLRAQLDGQGGAQAVAVIGAGLRLPGGIETLDGYWAALTAGRDLVHARPPGRKWPFTAEWDALPNRGGWLEEVLGFDADFFGISPREARALDPQQRLLLEVAWEALEHAGVPPRALKDVRTGFYLGITNADYRDWEPAGSDVYWATGNGNCFAAGRVAYTLGLTGPAVAVDTACSSSLVAVHQAVQALRRGECEVALAGGVNLLLSPRSTRYGKEMGSLAPDGLCKTFDARANGFTRGEGSGIVVLKRHADAVRDGDRVLGIIHGSAVNQDGRSTGFTAPNVLAQISLIEAALADARLTAADVGMVEAHGTGTALGDPIEMDALATALGRRNGGAPLHVGAVKTNLGHLEAAAGIAGLLKTLLCLRYRQIPPLVHFDTLNPRIDLSGTGIAVPGELTGWSPAAGRFAGVSAFGMSGTNAHVVLGAATDPAPLPAIRVDGFEISARDEGALRRLAGRFAAAADALDPADYPAFAYTATHGRTGHPVRAAIRATGPGEAAAALRAVAAGTGNPGTSPVTDSPEELPRRVADLPPYPWRRSRHAPEELDTPIPAYEVAWQPLDPAPAAATPLVLAGDDPAVLTPLAAAARAAGRDVTVLGPVPGNAGPVPAGDAEWAAFWGGRPVPAVLALAFTAAALPAGDAVAGDGALAVDSAVAADGARLCAAVTTAVRSLPAGAVAYALTTAARAAVPGDVCVPGVHGLVNGLGAVLGLEFPATWGGLVDLPAELSPAGAAALAGLLGSTGADDVLAVRGAAVHTARLRPAAVTAGAGGLPVDGDGTYLVTGALGGVGRAVVSDLVTRGARHLLLVGRTAAADLRPAARDALAAWRAAGATVTYRSADVADPAALAAAAAAVPGSPPLRGIVHAAGTLREVPLGTATEADFAEALGAKWAAAWQLRRLAAEHPVEFVVQLSSVTALWGTAGYGPYAAANGGLDLLAAVPGGPPTRTVAFGPWDVDGMVDPASLRGLARAGVGAVTAPVGCAALGAGPSTGDGYLVVCPVDWDRFTEVTAARRPRALFPDGTTAPSTAPPSAPPQAPAAAPSTAAPVAPAAAATPATEPVPATALVPVTARADLLALPEVARRDAVAGIVTAAVAAVLGHTGGRVPADVGFFDLGLDSMMAVDLAKALAAELGVPVTISDVFDHPTAGALADLLDGRLAGLPEPAPAAPEPFATVSGPDATEHAGPSAGPSAGPEPVADPSGAEPIAVVGMAGRFPGADSVEEFWALLRDGRDAVGDVPPSRWDSAALRADDPLRAGTVTTDQGGFLNDVDRFDAGFFGVPAREAENLDPQHRLLLESAWHALESAGTDPSGLAGSRTGVFVGISNSDYGRLLERGGLEGLDAYFGTGTALNAAAGRIAFTLGLRGPALAVDTACSSSLVAVHLAIRSLRQGESDRAIAGGVNVIAAPTASVAVSRAHMLSPEGRCKTFSAGADGFVRSEGVGVLVLRRLSDARRDGDPVLAVLHGSAVNSDGASSGLTVPSGRAQEDVIADALADARVAPGDIDLLEAHGTGTALGDPIELAAAWSVLGRGRAPGRPLHLGSVKSVVGHCESAAGVVALIKTVLALRHGQLPPNLHCAELNPHVPWQDMNVHVVDGLLPWRRRGERPRLAGVSGFGFSGTNAHVIVGEAPAAADRPAAAPGAVLLPLSAADEEGLARVTEAWTHRLADATDDETAALAATAGAGRAHLPVRRAAVGATREQLLAALGRGPAVRSSRPPRVAFLFSGQGSQYFGMGAELYRTEPVFRDVIDACAAHFGDALGAPLTDLMFAGTDRELINQTRVTQPALVALELALAALWRSWGVEPVAVLGHSVGEIAAAVHAGVLTLPAGLDLIAHRARLMQGTAAGSMLAVVAAPDVVAARIDGTGLDIAAVNGAQATVVAGEPAAVAAFAADLTAAGIQSRPLVVSHAFHSRLMEPILAQLRAAIDGLEHARPRIPIVANVTGRLAAPGQYDAGYWCEHVRRPVRFADGVEQLRELDIDLYLEIGPGRTLGNLATAAGAATAETALASLRRGAADRTALLGAARTLYERGQRLNWAAVQDGPRADAPRYPFAGTRYWVPAAAAAAAGAAAGAVPGTPHWGRELRSPGLAGGRVFSFERSPVFPPYLGDHRLYGTVVTPAASHLATLLSALAPGGQPITVEDFVCPRALVIKDDERYEVQLLVSEGDGEQPRISVQSLSDPVQGRWQEHMSGRLGAPAVAAPGAAPDPAAFIATAERHITGEEFYRQARELGYTLGPAFRWVGEAWLRGNDTLVRYRRPQLPDDPADYELYPGLIDSCFQSIAGFLGDGPDGESPELAIPFAARRLAFTGRPDAGDELWGHVTVTQAAPLSQGRWRVESADIRLFTGAGRTLFTADDFRVRAASRTVLRQSLKGGPSGGYRIEHVPLDTTPAVTPAVTPHGARVTMVGGTPALHAAAAALPAGDAELVADARFLDAAAAGAPEVRRAVWELVTSLRLASPDVPYAVLAAGGAQAAPLRQALWGMLAALEAEQPRRRLLRVTVEGVVDPALLAGVLARAAATGVPEPSLTVEAGAAQPVRVARLVPITAAAAIAEWPRNVLISGGLGALGLSSARLLARQGTAAVTLLGRSAPDPAAQEVIDDLIAAGVTVSVVRGDVTDPADCARAVAAATVTGPLHGVLHLAGALDDRPFDELDEASLAKVFAAKAAGAEHLAAAAAGQPLTAFVLFSSASSLLGSAGQTNYGAANGFLDGLAEALRAAGVPATSVNWGPWTPAVKGGMAAADAVRRAGERLGVRPLDDDGAAPLLELAVAGELPRLLAVDLEVARYAQQAAGHPRAALVAALSGSAAGSGGAASADTRPAQAKGWLRRDADGLAPDAREAVLRGAVRQMLGVIVGDAGAVDESLSFAEIGLDSIMVIDLRSRLEHAMGTDLPATVGIDYPTVPAITRFVHDLAYPEPAVGAAAAPAAETHPVAAGDPDTDLSGLSLDQLILAVQQDLISEKKG
ncbi:type I polyketide synthase [Dactylosporangium aurantiacum]|uniref:Type I polyketide synthase n=1 Tax=Dactylosporangium aurantiacum TaxID=35754 RepID=A0A9Q9INV8_9ACTN|nr:type I polyketide synthase [Dactylosporangium aurantiacum]MDG6109127.1 type I polyketide synthase [Dactylosporangium aurantiacum]UWZ58458.1 type I polyketide synthase [Dactylosporangium aurantiacum]